MSSKSFITVIPAIRTIPGVEEFDYAVHEGHGLDVGDVVMVSFRKNATPALVTRFSSTSAFASRAVTLEHPVPVLRLGKYFPELVRHCATRTLSSRPSVLYSWIRHVPKRALADATPRAAQQTDIPVRQTRYLADRWTGKGGLIETARKTTGKTLIVTPWQHRADALGKILSCPVLHADLAMGQAWSTVRQFVDGTASLLVTTRLGAWLASQAGTVLIDEPENDDFKQDELAPRFDARWIIDQCAELQPDLSVISFSTTPALSRPAADRALAPTIELDLRTEPKLFRGASTIRDLSEQTIADIEQALEDKQPVTIIHPIRGEQARISCRDCGWAAICTACSFPLSLVNQRAICRRCGRKGELPDECPSCGGSDLSRGRAGTSRLTDQLHARFNSSLISVHDTWQLQQATLPPHGLAIITDLSLIGGATEDIRRRERLIISWRRLAASLVARQTRTVVQGPEETLVECRDWLTSDGLAHAWQQELNERAAFGYPPAARLVKILSTGSELQAQQLFDELSAILPKEMKLRGPFPVAFRAKTRGERFVLHVSAPQHTTDEKLVKLLERFNKRAIIDLDPIAFFS
jgi:primosomal protein N'